MTHCQEWWFLSLFFSLSVLSYTRDNKIIQHCAFPTHSHRTQEFSANTLQRALSSSCCPLSERHGIYRNNVIVWADVHHIACVKNTADTSAFRTARAGELSVKVLSVHIYSTSLTCLELSSFTFYCHFALNSCLTLNLCITF